jgi:hypothetical protein
MGIAVELEQRTLYRLGGVAALLLGLSYVGITGLYAIAGAVPSDGGQAWLAYLDGKSGLWWGITGLSVLTDLLFLPLAAALYVALRDGDRTVLLIGVGMLALFAVLDLAVTWPNYASLITLSGSYAVAPDEPSRAALVAAAGSPSSVLGSGLFRIYAILVPALGIFAISVVMLRVPLSRFAAYVGLATGVLGVLYVVDTLAWGALGALVILTSILTTVWVLVVGYRLLSAARS